MPQGYSGLGQLLGLLGQSGVFNMSRRAQPSRSRGMLGSLSGFGSGLGSYGTGSSLSALLGGLFPEGGSGEVAGTLMGSQASPGYASAGQAEQQSSRFRQPGVGRAFNQLESPYKRAFNSEI